MASVGLRCEGGTILAIGPEVTPGPDDETVDAHFADLAAPGDRGPAIDPTVLPATEALAVATGARSPLLGGGAKPLTPGAPADFLLLRGDSPELGIGDLASDLVYAASGAAVDTTVVAGRVLMRGGEVEGTAEIVARAVERARRLGIGSS